MSSNRQIPRLTFEELPRSVAERLRPKYERLGYLGEFFAAAAHQEAALAAFIDFTDAAKGGLPMNVVELIALTVSVMKGVDYERNQHERLAVNLGLGRDWVAAVEKLAPAEAGLSELEGTVQRFIIAAVERDGRQVSAELQAVVAALGHRETVAVLMVMARYVSHALLVNSLEIAAPVPSIFDPGYDAPKRQEDAT